MHDKRWQAVCGYLIDGCESLPDNADMRCLFECIFGNKDAIYATYYENGGLKRVRYSDMRAYSAALAERIDGLIPKDAEIVGLHIINSPAWVLFYWALLMTGHVPLLLDARLNAAHYADILSENGVKYVITRDKSDFAISPDTPLAGLGRGDDAMYSGRWANGVIFLTSGTSGRERLLLYNGQRLAHQIQIGRSMYADNSDIMYPPQLGSLRQLALMPFSHMFGFMICIILYPYFSKETVFPSALTPAALAKTCRDARVTHIFASPIVFTRLADEANVIAMRMFGTNGKKILSRLRSGAQQKELTKFALKLRRNWLGLQIRCIISGGAMASESDAALFNRAGYRFVNGYGLTELGILAVETSNNCDTRISCFCGKPMYGVTVTLDESGEMIIKSAFSAVGYIEKGTLRPLETPFRTGDLASILPDGRIKLNGRRDDMLMLVSGDRVHPRDIEREFINIKNVSRVCCVCDAGSVALVVLPLDMSEGALSETAAAISERNAYLTPQHRIASAYAIKELPLSMKGDFDRNAIAQKIESLIPLALNESDNSDIRASLVARVTGVFAAVLNKDMSTISENADFFTELGGDSLLYATLAATIESEFGVRIPSQEYANLTTIARCARVVNKYEGNV